jgi:cell division transport system permease protein
MKLEAIIVRKIRSFKTMMVNGFISIWRNKGMGLVSIVTIFAVMLIVGILLLTVLNINGFVQTINSSLDKVIVYLNDDTTVEETNGLLFELSEKPEVEMLTYVSKEQAIIKAQDMFSEGSFIQSGLEKNPFPASIIIELKNIDTADQMVKTLDTDSRVEEIRYYKDLIEKFIQVNRVIKIGGFIAFIVIVTLSIFVISNIIKVAIASRGEEIEIMKYVGASESFIKGPFVIEGLFYSVLGSALSLITVFYIYNKFIEVYERPIYEYVSYQLIEINEIALDIGIIFVAIAIGIGSIGSLTSIKKYLKV